MIRIETKAGHGAGKSTQQTIDEQTDKWSFMFYKIRSIKSNNSRFQGISFINKIGKILVSRKVVAISMKIALSEKIINYFSVRKP